MNSDFYLLITYFFKYNFQQIFYPFSNSFKYYFFIFLNIFLFFLCRSPFVVEREQEERITPFFFFFFSFSCLILLVDVNDLTVLEFEKTTRRIQEKI